MKINYLNMQHRIKFINDEFDAMLQELKEEK
jgi:hypothetical protein